MKIALATGSADDAASLKRALAGLKADIQHRPDIGVMNGSNLAEIAMKKARHVAKGFPGGWVMAIAFASQMKGESLAAVAERLKLLQPQARWRTYNAVFVVIGRDGRETSFKGQMRGTLGDDGKIALAYHGPLFTQVYDFLVVESC